jgi:hypothetical protein
VLGDHWQGGAVLLTCRRAHALAAVAALLVATPAGATVSIDTSAVGGRCVKLGVWYQAFSGRPHRITAKLYSGGELIASRSLIAGSRWRRFIIDCPAPGRYSLVTTYRGRSSLAAEVTTPGPRPARPMVNV